MFTAVILDALKGRADAETLGNKDGGSVWSSRPKTRCSVCEEARKILPSHAQQAAIYFSGGNFFNIAAAQR